MCVAGRRLEAVRGELDQQAERVLEVDRVHEAPVLDAAVLDAPLVEPLDGLVEGRLRERERDVVDAAGVGGRAVRGALAVLVGEDRDQAAVARVEVEVALGLVVEVGLLEDERHAEDALPEVDRGLPVGPDQSDVVNALRLKLSHPFPPYRRSSVAFVQMATFCLIHGNWHDGSCWDQLVPALEAARPPGGCAGPPRRRSRDHLGRPRRPAPGPALGCRRPGRRGRPLGRLRLRRHRRRSEPRRSCSSTSARGWRSSTIRQGSRASSARRSRFRRGATTARSSGSRRTRCRQMYPRLDPETARALAARLRPTAPPAGEFPLERPADVPTALVYATDDEFFEPAYERFIARELLGSRADRDPGRPLPDGGGPGAAG